MMHAPNIVTVLKKILNTIHFHILQGHNGKIHFTFEHHPSWSNRSLDEHVPVEVSIRHIKALIDPFQLEIQRIHSYEGWQSKRILSKT